MSESPVNTQSEAATLPALLARELAGLDLAGRWLVGLSGGVDSVVLLHALLATGPTQPVVAVHVNHGLSSLTDEWEAHCRALCQAWGVALEIRQLHLGEGGSGIEERARLARYGVFRELMQPADALLLGHHRSDQAETVLFRLMRGAGVRGLAAMASHRPLAGGRLLRPLLSLGREAIEAYAKAQGLSWVEDHSNTDTDFDRNYLRHKVLPLLAARWPEAERQLVRTAEHCREADALLADLAALDLSACDEQPAALGFSVKRSALQALTPKRQRNLLRHWLLRRYGQLPGHQALADIDSQLLRGDSHSACIGLSWCQLRVYGGRLFALDLQRQWQPSAAEPTLYWVDLAEPLRLPGGDSLQLGPARVGEGLAERFCASSAEVRWRKGGERCHPADRGHSQTLKKLLQEYDLPTWLRSRVPLLYLDGELAAVGDLWVCREFAAAADEPGRPLSWQQP